jgi:hypothetical protein
VLKPIAYALMDKHMRSRILIHDVPERQLPHILTDFGIHEDMLPTGMGGSVQLDQAEWLTNQRAAELMEI